MRITIRHRGPAVFAALALVACANAFAQTTTTTPTSQPTPVPPSGMSDRLFLAFAQDAVIVPSQWWEGQAEYDDGAQDIPVDVLLARAVVAFQPFRNIEVGGRVGFGTTDADPSLPDGSGATDLDAYAKYFFGGAADRADFTAGALVTVPTGDDNVGLGYNAFALGGFGAARYRLDSAVIGGNVGVRFNGDGDLLGFAIDGKTSFQLGVSALVPMGNAFSFVGEAQIETERFDGFDSTADLLVGANWKAFGRGMLRGAFGVGLTDSSPNFRAIVGYAYSF
jgi:hypothetical protein